MMAIVWIIDAVAGLGLLMCWLDDMLVCCGLNMESGVEARVQEISAILDWA